MLTSRLRDLNAWPATATSLEFLRVSKPEPTRRYKSGNQVKCVISDLADNFDTVATESEDA